MRIGIATGATLNARHESRPLPAQLAALRFADSQVCSAENCWAEYGQHLDSYLARCVLRDGAAPPSEVVEMQAGRLKMAPGVQVFARLPGRDPVIDEPIFYLCVPGDELQTSRFAVAIVDFDDEDGCQLHVEPLMKWKTFRAGYLRSGT